MQTKSAVSKGYWPQARRPWATHEGNKSHNHELKADKSLIPLAY